MSVKEFALDNIHPNPYQTRLSEDAQHIKDLAISIGEHGMLQIPTGRMKDAENVELAFGHSRLAGHKFLTDTGNAGFTTMRVNVEELDDLQMFQMAVSENLDRKNLTPIEEALAMKTYQEKFNKTSEEVGKLFHLSDSAVRGKMRLLNLPNEVKSAVGSTLTEGAAREALTFYGLPEKIEFDHQWDAQRYRENKQEIEKLITTGASAELLAEKITHLVEHAGEDMSDKPWKHTDEFIGKDGEPIKLCKGCPSLIKREHDVCLEPECYKAKKLAWQKQYLQQASLLSGIPVVVDDDDLSDHFTTFSYGSESKLKKIRQAKCENLRLVFDRYAVDPKYHRGGSDADHLGKEGFPGAQIVCLKRSGFCTCMNAMDAGLKLDDGGVAGTKEDLKELNRQKKEQAKIDKELMERMYCEGAEKIEAALMATPEQVLMLVLKYLNYIKFSDLEKASKEIIKLNVRAAVAEYLVKRDAYSYIVDKNIALKAINERLRIAGLEPLTIVIGKNIESEVSFPVVAQSTSSQDTQDETEALLPVAGEDAAGAGNASSIREERSGTQDETEALL